jgi:hypothetical protein
MSSRVHHEKCHIAISEVVIMLSRNARIVVGFRVVNAERVVSVCEGRRVVGLAHVVVDDLQARAQHLELCHSRKERPDLVVVICMDDG